MNLSFAKRPTLHRLTFIALCACYIAVFLNIAFYRQVLSASPLDSIHAILFFLSMPLVAFCVINIVLTVASFLWLDRILAALFIVLCASTQYFIWNFGVVIDRSMVVNIIDTTPAESFALMSTKLVLVIGLTGILAAVLTFWFRIRRSKSHLNSVMTRLVSIVVSVLCILLVASLFYKDYASLFRNEKELIKSLGPSNSIAATLSWYKHNQMAHLPLVQIGTDAKTNPKMLNGTKKNLTIIVLGETTRAVNFQLNGYERENTPLLAKDDVTYFPNTESCGTATAVSVPCMFSNMPRAHYDADLASHQEGLLDIIQRAGTQVLWNDNDGGCKGACDRVPNQNMTTLNLAGMCHDGECYDDVLFHGLDDYINNLKGNGIIVLHTIGSHGPTYYNRYPEKFRKFEPTCDTNQIQDCSHQQLVNTYDNTVLYIDYIVDKAIGVLKAHQDQFNTSLVYLSDHGESLGEDGVYLHGLPYSIAPSEQTHVPMLIWLSEDYRKQFGVDKQCLDKLAGDKQFAQDNLFSTVLGMTGTETSEYKRTDDILAACRSGN